MNRKFLFLALISLSAFWSCDFEIDELYQPAAVKAADIQLILETIAAKGWPQPDTTESGARYIIFEGRGDGSNISPKSQDIVRFDYIGYQLDGNVFDTSIPAVADTAFTSTGNVVFEPVVYTYSETGWTLRYVPVVSQYLFSNSPSTALQEGISDAFRQMKVGDVVTIFLPSTEAGTPSRPREQARPIYFEIILIGIEPK